MHTKASTGPTFPPHDLKNVPTIYTYCNQRDEPENNSKVVFSLLKLNISSLTSKHEEHEERRKLKQQIDHAGGLIITSTAKRMVIYNRSPFGISVIINKMSWTKSSQNAQAASSYSKSVREIHESYGYRRQHYPMKNKYLDTRDRWDEEFQERWSWRVEDIFIIHHWWSCPPTSFIPSIPFVIFTIIYFVHFIVNEASGGGLQRGNRSFSDFRLHRRIPPLIIVIIILLRGSCVKDDEFCNFIGWKWGYRSSDQLDNAERKK